MMAGVRYTRQSLACGRVDKSRKLQRAYGNHFESNLLCACGCNFAQNFHIYCHKLKPLQRKRWAASNSMAGPILGLTISVNPSRNRFPSFCLIRFHKFFKATLLFPFPVNGGSSYSKFVKLLQAYSNWILWRRRRRASCTMARPIRGLAISITVSHFFTLWTPLLGIRLPTITARIFWGWVLFIQKASGSSCVQSF